MYVHIPTSDYSILFVRPICYIFVSSYPRVCEARESAIMCTLIYFNDVLSYIRYTEYLLQYI